MRGLACTSLLVLALAATGSSATTRWRDYEDRAYGWRFSYPTGFEPSRFQGFSRIAWYGVSFANFPAVAPSVWPLQRPRMPPDGVLLRFWHQEGGPHHHPVPRDDGLPLTLRRLRSYPVDPRPRPRVGVFQLGGTELSVAVWVGRRARERDRAAAAAIVRRFRPARLEAGGLTKPCGFFVLDRIGELGMRAVLRYDADELPRSDCVSPRPFYLVRVRRDLYALGWPRDSHGYKDCGVRLDARRFEFFCPNGARWTRFGRVIAVPRGWNGDGDPLARYTVVRAYDGHVLVTTSSYRYPWPP